MRIAASRASWARCVARVRDHSTHPTSAATSASPPPPPPPTQTHATADAGGRWRTPWVLGVAAASGIGGFMLGASDERSKQRVLPKVPRACCEAPPPPPLTAAQAALVEKLRAVVGADHVRTSNIAAFTVGARMGKGEALAVVQPGTLQQAVDALQACVDADVAVVPQGANTGLTGGSVPRDTLCERPTVILSARRLTATTLSPDASKVLCFAGAGIFDLKEKLAQHGRAAHTELGSIFLNPSVGAGVAFGSGGTQLRVGPAYTERVLYCHISPKGKVELVDSLGIKPSTRGEGAVAALDAGAFTFDERCKRPASYPQYRQHVCTLDGAVARSNADTRGPPPCRSEGKVLLLASVHDTFPLPVAQRVLWVGCTTFEQAAAVRRLVLSDPHGLPKSCEYMGRDAVDIIDGAGRATSQIMQLAGMKRMAPLWDIKVWVESLPIPFAKTLIDTMLFHLNSLLPCQLPPAVATVALKYDHNLLIECADYGGGEAAAFEAKLAALAAADQGSIVYHRCADDAEVQAVKRFRFVGNPSFRTWCVGHGLQGLSVDYALPKRFEEVPELLNAAPAVKRMRYGHYGCNVIHESLAFAPGVDVKAEKAAIKRRLEALGGVLPAEHGFGTEYPAPADSQKRWKAMDPTNTMNPGVGGLSYKKGYA